jgi:hypothetical protein
VPFDASLAALVAIASPHTSAIPQTIVSFMIHLLIALRAYRHCRPMSLDIFNDQHLHI